MVLSVIYNYIDKDGNEMLSIGSMGHMKQKTKGCRQIIKFLGINQNEQQREYMVSLNNNELYAVLTKFMEKNELYIIRPN